MRTLGKPQLISLARLLEAQHGVRLGLVGHDVYVYGAGKDGAKLAAVRQHSKELKAELVADAAIKRAQASARQQVVRSCR